MDLKAASSGGYTSRHHGASLKTLEAEVVAANSSLLKFELDLVAAEDVLARLFIRHI